MRIIASLLLLNIERPARKLWPWWTVPSCIQQMVVVRNRIHHLATTTQTAPGAGNVVTAGVPTKPILKLHSRLIDPAEIPEDILNTPLPMVIIQLREFDRFLFFRTYPVELKLNRMVARFDVVNTKSPNYTRKCFYGKRTKGSGLFLLKHGVQLLPTWYLSGTYGWCHK